LYFTKDARLISTISISAVLFVDNVFVSISNCNNVQEFFFDRFRVIYLSSLFQILLIAEKLYYNIKIYFEDFCQNINFDNYKTLLNSNSAELYNNLYNKFDSYCFTATILKERKLHIEFCYTLFKISALVEQIFRVEYSRILVCFLEVFIYFIQIELSEIAFIFRNFIKKISEKVTKKKYSWNQIYRLLEELDSKSLDLTIAQIWKYTTDTFKSELETFNRLAVSVCLDYIKRVYRFKEYFEEEQLLRDLLA